MSKFTSSYDVDNRYRFYKSLDSKRDISPSRRGVRPGVDDNSSKNFLNSFRKSFEKTLKEASAAASSPHVEIFSF